MLIRTGKLPHRARWVEFEETHHTYCYLSNENEPGAVSLAYAEVHAGKPEKTVRMHLSMSSTEARELAKVLVEMADKAEGKF